MDRADTSYTHPPIREDGMEQCVRCGEIFGGERASMEVNHTSGPVVNADTGAEYEVVIESPAGDPLMHIECYEEHEAERRAAENASLEEFA